MKLNQKLTKAEQSTGLGRNELFDLYYSKPVQTMFGKFCYRYRNSIKDPDDREGACNLAFTLATKNHIDGRQEFTSSLYKFLSWQFDSHAKAVPQQNVSIDTGVDIVDNFNIEKAEMLESLSNVIHLLSDKQKDIVQLILTSHSINEISHQTNLPISKVQRLYNNAVEIIRLEMETEHG